MNEWLVAALVLIAALAVLLPLPTLLPAIDGLVVLEASGTIFTAVLLLLAEGLHRQPFVDLALVFSPLSFVGSLAFARLMERRV
jgi:multisubunit Na+/H+ antiporter MnhF subunit